MCAHCRDNGFHLSSQVLLMSASYDSSQSVSWKLNSPLQDILPLQGVMPLHFEDCLSFVWLKNHNIPSPLLFYTSAQDTILWQLFCLPKKCKPYTGHMYTHQNSTLWYSLYAHHLNLSFGIPQWGNTRATYLLACRVPPLDLTMASTVLQLCQITPDQVSMQPHTYKSHMKKRPGTNVYTDLLPLQPTVAPQG